MKIVPLIVKMAVITITLSFYIMLMVNICSLVSPNNIKLEIPPENEWSYTNFENRILIKTNARIYNGANQDITEFQLRLFLMDSQENIISEMQGEKINLKIGEWSDVPINLDIDLNHINEDSLKKLLFEHENLNVKIQAKASFFFRLIRFDFQFNQHIQSGPLIYDISIDTSEIHLINAGQKYILALPIQISSARMINGQSIDIAITLYNSTTMLGQEILAIKIQDVNYDLAQIEISEEAFNHLKKYPDHLTIKMSLKIFEVKKNIEYNFEWEPQVG